ncbi:sialin-like isoform X2 [Dysidea avara]|uniref:sialin-like isoform X2 n=1 Tax=Dysidea avara TaxID=196820 RepID=UPI003319204A
MCSKGTESTYLLRGSGKKRLDRWFPRCWYVDWVPCIKARYVLLFMIFLGLCNVYALRVNLSVAIVPMTTENSRPGQRSFDWTDAEQGWVLSSFFYGYIFTQLPGGWMATKFGGKYVFGVGVLVTSLLTLITPLMAYFNLWALVACRVVTGFFEGTTIPATNAMFGKWAPPLERSIMGTIAVAGMYVGNIVGFPLSGVLCGTMGWPWAFYCFGIFGIIWFVAWLILVFSTPADHPRISPEEQHYIESSIGSQIYDNASKKCSPTPWKGIFTSPVILGIAIGHFANSWGFYTLLTCLPTYLNQTLCVNITKNGLYSAIPYVCLAVVSIFWGHVTDALRQRKLVTTTVIRKFNTTLGFCIPAVFLVLCGVYGSTTRWAIIFLSLSVGLSGFSVAGFNINLLDIAPQYAGILMGISNTVATIPGFVGPQVAKFIAKEPNIETCDDSCNNPTIIDMYRQEWTLVFITTAELYVFGAIIYLLLGSSEKQWWTKGTEHMTDNMQASSPFNLQPFIPNETEM